MEEPLFFLADNFWYISIQPLFNRSSDDGRNRGLSAASHFQQLHPNGGRESPNGRFIFHVGQCISSRTPCKPAIPEVSYLSRSILSIARMHSSSNRFSSSVVSPRAKARTFWRALSSSYQLSVSGGMPIGHPARIARSALRQRRSHHASMSLFMVSRNSSLLQIIWVYMSVVGRMAKRRREGWRVKAAQEAAPQPHWWPGSAAISEASVQSTPQ